MLGSTFIAGASGIVLALGCAHTYYTFFTHQLEPYDAQVRATLATATPALSREMSVARSTKGFNASHALGLVFFALFNGYLAIFQPRELATSPFFLICGTLVFAAYLVIAKRYFFSTPFRGVVVAALAYVIGALFIALGR